MNSRKNYLRNYYLKNRNKIKECSRKYHKTHKKELEKTRQIYRETHKEEMKDYQKEYRKIHKEEIAKKAKIYRLKYRKNIKKQKKIYYKIHKKQRNQYIKNKRKMDINFRIADYLRRRTNLALKGICKSESTMKLLGCSLDLLRLHLQSQFQTGMSFENYGKWHIDHIRPCASFDLSKISEQYKCFNYKNLQPLWEIDNLRKGAKLCR